MDQSYQKLNSKRLFFAFNKPNSIWKRVFFFITLTLYFGFILDGRPFATPDEGRYVEIPREMLERNDYVTPHLNGYKYFEKPALFYWVQAGFMKVFGTSEVSMRLSLFLLAFGLCVSLFYTLRQTHQENFAYLATAIFAFNPFVFTHFHLIILDVPLTFFTSLAFFSFYLALENSGLKRRLFAYGFAISCALGILTKGIVILAIVGPVVLAWLTLTKQWRQVLPLYLPTSIALFLAVVLPWHILAAIKNPDFLHKYFYVEHFLRYTTSIHKRDQGWWFFIPFLLAGFLPWSLFLVARIKSLWESKKQDKLVTLCTLWISWTLFFFSLSSSKLIPYILPIFPALAVMNAHAIKIWLQENKPPLKLTGWLLFILGLVTFIASGYIEHQEIYNSITFYTMVLGSVLAGTGLWLVVSQKHNLIALILCGVFCSLCAHFTLKDAQKPSLKPLTNELVKMRKANEPVVSFGTYLQDLPYYIKEVVYVFEHLSELEYGHSQVTDDIRYIPNKEVLKKLSSTHKTIWLVMRKRKWQEYNFSDLSVKLVWQNQDYVLAKMQK